MVRSGSINGHQALWLENDFLQLSVLPEKGADIYELIYKPSGIDFLMKTPAGLKPPSVQPQGHFLENYEGAWQELFPNANAECTYQGKSIPFHGEVALLPWEVSLPGKEDGTAAKFSLTCQQTPFSIEKTLRLHPDRPQLDIEETIINLSDEPVHFVGGQHIVLGGNFLEEGCRIETSATRLETPAAEELEETARLLPAQQSTYPFAHSRTPGERIDLSIVPSPAVHSHDDAFITGFQEGVIKVINPRLKLTIRLDWDKEIFPWMVLWQPYGGAVMPPLTGTYGLGIEPWVSRYNLAESIQHACAASLAPRSSINTTFRVTIETR